MLIRIGKTLLVTVMGIFLCSSFLLAEEVRVEATVNTNKVSLQDMVELTVSIYGVQGQIPAVNLPPIEGFDARFVGPSTKFTIVNGSSSSEHSFIYNLFPFKVGRFQIPSLSLTLDGKTYQTSPINIEVVDKPLDSPDEEKSSSESISDKVFMQASIEPKEVYIGQKTPLTIKVFVKDLSLQLAGVPALTPDGFTADSTANMQKSKEIINGVTFNSLTFDTNVYPTRTGKVNVGPLSAQGELVYRLKKSNDILGDLFSNTQTRPITLHAPAISLNVLPLPAQDQPKYFLGAVGQYDFKASVGPSSVKVGDPLTLHLSVSGQGQLKDLVMPVFNDSRFKTYDPQVKVDDSSKTIEQVIIPTSQNITEVPALSFSYFDPLERKYKTITQGPFPVKVLPPVPGEEFKAYGFVDKTKPSSEFKGQGLRAQLEKALKMTETLLMDLRFWLIVLMATIGWVIWNIWKDFQSRLQSDKAFSRKWKADAKARELLKKTEIYLHENNPKEFYKSVHKTLNDYFADKMHLPIAGLTWPTIERYLKDRSVEPSRLETMRTLFERSELVRFASAGVSQQEMTSDFQRLQEMVSYLSKILK